MMKEGNTLTLEKWSLRLAKDKRDFFFFFEKDKTTNWKVINWTNKKRSPNHRLQYIQADELQEIEISIWNNRKLPADIYSSNHQQIPPDFHSYPRNKKEPKQEKNPLKIENFPIESSQKPHDTQIEKGFKDHIHTSKSIKEI